MAENNAKKTISASTIVIIILSIVIVLMLIFGVIFFFMIRSNKDENPTAVSNTNSQVTAENETSKNNVSTNETTNTATTTTQPVSNGNISDDWKDCEFIFNNKTYKLYVPYSDLKNDGWSFDLADYGYSNGYVMNPGDKSYRNNWYWKS